MLWCMQRTNIYLDDRQVRAMDELAAEAGVSRAEVVRRLIDEGLSRGRSGGDTVAAIRESFGVYQDLEAPRREAAERDEDLERLRAR